MAEPGFEWFTRWVNQHLGATLTFARKPSWQEMAPCFGVAPAVVGTATFLEAGVRDGTNLRFGAVGPWGYAVEALSVLGADPATLRCLSGNGGEAFALCYTQTIDTFSYANNGRSVFGFDMTLPNRRYGEEPERFAAELEQAGFLDDGVPTPAMGAKFVDLAFGITLDREMLERPLPVVAVA
jgi:hypothetical protein